MADHAVAALLSRAVQPFGAGAISLSGPPGRLDGRITITVTAARTGSSRIILSGMLRPSRSLRGRTGRRVRPPRAAAVASAVPDCHSGITPVRTMLYGLLADLATRERRGSPGCLPLALRRAEMPSAVGCPILVLLHSVATPKASFSVRNCVPWRRGLRICGCTSGTREPGAISGRPTCRTCVPDGTERSAWAAGRQGRSKKRATGTPRSHNEFMPCAGSSNSLQLRLAGPADRLGRQAHPATGPTRTQTPPTRTRGTTRPRVPPIVLGTTPSSADRQGLSAPRLPVDRLAKGPAGHERAAWSDGVLRAPDKGKLEGVRVHGEARMGPQDSPVSTVIDPRGKDRSCLTRLY